MKIDFNTFKDVLTKDEMTVLKLRALYVSHGYSQYKMSKFEEYDLYVKNKDFLVSDSVITFTDTDGRLLALKPDVTLSIIKNSADIGRGALKLCYNENVYRVSKGTHAFREIMQLGLECLGDIDTDRITEVVYLATESLRQISDESCLELSHLDIVSGVLSYIGISQDAGKRVLGALGQKNWSLADSILADEGAALEKRRLLEELFSTYGEADSVLDSLDKFAVNKEAADAIDRLRSVVRGVKALSPDAKMRVDFSLLGDTTYYNGIAFSGFVNGVPTAVLSGGQYDNLMDRMKRRDRAIGFAVYLDELERL